MSVGDSLKMCFSSVVMHQIAPTQQPKQQPSQGVMMRHFKNVCKKRVSRAVKCNWHTHVASQIYCPYLFRRDCACEILWLSWDATEAKQSSVTWNCLQVHAIDFTEHASLRHDWTEKNWSGCIWLLRLMIIATKSTSWAHWMSAGVCSLEQLILYS